MKLIAPSLLALAGVASATLHLDLNLGGSHPHVHASSSKLGAENPHAWIAAGDGDGTSSQDHGPTRC